MSGYIVSKYDRSRGMLLYAVTPEWPVKWTPVRPKAMIFLHEEAHLLCRQLGKEVSASIERAA